jgi:hypothetical protein
LCQNCAIFATFWVKVLFLGLKSEKANAKRGLLKRKPRIFKVKTRFLKQKRGFSKRKSERKRAKVLFLGRKLKKQSKKP